VRVFNSVLKCTGSAYNACATNQTAFFYNISAIGNLSATSGSRGGFIGTIGHAFNCFAANHVGDGFMNGSNAANHASIFTRCTAVNCNNGFARTGTSVSPTSVSAFINCLAANCTGNGFLATGNNRAYVVHGRTRDNTSGNAIDNFSLDSVYTIDSDDATEFVNAAGGDYRIKYGSSLWGKGYGPGDEPAASGGGLFLPRGFDGGYAG
jgi:hypothetical protein